MVKMNITDIDYPDRTFDVILCNHVLEHVDDDRRAMREFNRVLKDDGWAILVVPISGNKTYEDASIVDPAERYEAFGQSDQSGFMERISPIALARQAFASTSVMCKMLPIMMKLSD